ncbi:MAG: hypothetical protein PHS84_00835 [Paludibacter sp.]|nr:hypothetical protein [Paludibacter sp.]
MRKYAKLVLASLFLFSMSIMAQEQTPRANGQQTESRPGGRQQMSAKDRAESTAKDLGLTDEVKAQVQALYEKNDEAFAKFRSETSRESPDFREKFKALRDAQDADLKKIIGEEKFEALQKIRAERRKMRNN